jgi:glycosyltransferase involved in cell wall biosynthesis
MRIAFNTISENPLNPSGSLDFFVQMTRMLVGSDPENSYFIFCSKSNRHLFRQLEGRATLVVAGKSNENRILRIISEQTFVPFLLRKLKIDVFFTSSGGGAVPLLTSASTKIVSAIYGTHHLKDGLNVGFARKSYRNYMTKMSMRKASVVVVNSESCKRDLMDHLQISEAKVRRIFHGIDLQRFHPGELDSAEKDFLAAYGVKSPFVLFVSVIWYYKNAHTLVEAFGKLVSGKRIPGNVDLVFVGDFDLRSGLDLDTNYRDLLDRLADKYGVEDRVRYVGFVPNERMRPFYKAAEAYVQPSFHETFGKTVVEAMACGCPVIGADTSSTSEIVGDYGLLFASEDSDKLAEYIEQVLLRPALRDEMKNKSLERAKMFAAEAEVSSFISLFKEFENTN